MQESKEEERRNKKLNLGKERRLQTVQWKRSYHLGLLLKKATAYIVKLLVLGRSQAVYCSKILLSAFWKGWL